MKHPLIVSLGASACLLGCASIESQESPSGNPIQGLSYYMPQKDFVVTLTVKGQKPEKATIATTAAYPDLSRQYVLRYGRNWLGKNSLDVTVTSTGLLSTAKSSTQSGGTDAFKGLASGVAGLQAMAFRPEPVGPACNTDGEYTFIFQKPGVYEPCAGAVTVTVGAPSGQLAPREKWMPAEQASASEGAQAGIFLPPRVALPGDGDGRRGEPIGDRLVAIGRSPAFPADCAHLLLEQQCRLRARERGARTLQARKRWRGRGLVQAAGRCAGRLLLGGGQPV